MKTVAIAVAVALPFVAFFVWLAYSLETGLYMPLGQ